MGHVHILLDEMGLDETGINLDINVYMVATIVLVVSNKPI